MKKVFAFILGVVLLTGILGVNVGATSSYSSYNNTQQIISETVEYLPDGNSVVVTVLEDTVLMSRATTYTKTGSKTYTLRNSSGDVLWKFTVNGTFSVNSGVSATCTGSSYSTSSLASGWSLKSGSSSRSGNQAIGDGTFQHKTLFIVTDTKSCHVVLSCDANGNLS